MTSARKVVRNSIYGVMAEAIGGVMSFLIIILIARGLGTDSFGLFSFVLALTSIFQLVADFGLTNIILKEIARAKTDTIRVISAVKPLVWLFSGAIMLVMASVAYPLAPSQEVYVATLVMGAAVLSTFHAVIYGSVCRAHEDMGYNAVAFVSHKVVLLAIVLLVLRDHQGIVGVSIAYLVANVYQWFFFYWIVRRRYIGHGVRWRVDYSYWRYLIAEAFPVGIAMVFRRANLHTGTLILTAVSTSSVVGIFNAAYRIIQMVDMIPFTLSIPLFPPFSRMAVESRARLFETLERVIGIFMLIAAPVFVLLFMLADRIVHLVYGQAYLEAILDLRILAAAVLCLFPTGLFIYVFSAMGQQRLYTFSSGICLATNVLAGLLLIPVYGHIGAALAILASEVAFLVSGLLLLHRLGFAPRYLQMLGKPLAAAGLSGAWMIVLSDDALPAEWMAVLSEGGLPAAWMAFLPEGGHPAIILLLAVIGYGVAYPATALLFGLIKKKDISVVFEAVRFRPSRIGGQN